ncbi:MAG: hypothetical protein AAFO82_22500 [Bacteroidota bacterium]
MKKNKHEWIESVLNSMEGMQKAQPKDDLFAKIKTQIVQPEARIISLRQRNWVAIAAVFLLLFNVFAIRQYYNNPSADYEQLVQGEDSNQQLVYDYNFYE